MSTLAVDLDGYTDLPPGRLCAFVTHLERTRPPGPPRPAPSGARLAAFAAEDLARYRRLFAAVGEPWLWFGRRGLDDAALAAIVGDPAVEVFAVVRDGIDVGLVELDARVAGEVELAYFGLVPTAVGTGLGGWMMDEALTRAFARSPARVRVHTCSFDHPGALAFYRRSGFVPIRFQVEIGPDPRLTGLLPRSAAPQIPLIDP